MMELKKHTEAHQGTITMHGRRGDEAQQYLLLVVVLLINLKKGQRRGADIVTFTFKI